MRKVKPFNVLLKGGGRYILLAVLLFVNLLTRAQTVDSGAVKTKAAVQRPVPVAQDDLEDPVFYESLDSIVYDAATKRLMLYRDAQIKYQDIIVDASFIEYLQDSSTMRADALEWEKDSVDKHLLTKGEEKTKFKDMRFNFKSQRALLSNAYSQYGEGFIKSERIKRNKDKSIYGLHNIYTTCNLEHPHFGIAAKKVKIIPNKVAVSGSANLVVEDIPTPLYLPFGLFPLKKGQRSGFKLPTYDVSQNLGFGLRGGGYYFAINDHLDLLAQADIYSLGTYRIGAINNYVWRYRFRGNLQFDYAYNKIGNEFETSSNDSRNFIINWSHTLDPNVRPGSNFSANVTIGTSKYYTNNSYDASRYLNNNYSSSINYTKTWEGKPLNLSVSARHNQNTQTGLVNVTLPEINFSANQLYPFKFRKDVIKPKWYEKITASYQLSAVNQYEFVDTQFNFNTLNTNDFNNGIKHTVPITATYNLFKYINANFTANYNEYWFSRRMFQSFDFQEQKLDSVITNGFYAARDFNVNASFSTRIYGIKLFNKGRVKGIRHVMTPSVSLQYRPDFGLPQYGFYYDTYAGNSFNRSRLSYFQGSPYGGPPNGEIGGVGFSLGNNLQMKVKSKDSTKEDRKINLIDGLSLGTFYNLAVDSFNWSNLTMAYRTTLFKKINISGGASWSPYGIDTSATIPVRVKEFYFETDRKVLRFENATLAVGASFPLRNKQDKKDNDDFDDQLINNGINYANYVDFNIPYTLNINYNIRLNRQHLRDQLTNAYKDSLVFGQDLNFSGDVNLTPKWKIGLQSGYDFINKNLSFTSIDIYRDLHCWEMRINVIPFGFRKSYNFTLNVKASVLQDLKLVRRKDFRDNL